MSKNYVHKQPHKSEQQQLRAANTKLINELQNATKELERLQIALKMITGEDKEDLLKAVDHIKDMKDLYNSPSITIHSDGLTQHTYVGTGTTQIIYDDVYTGDPMTAPIKVRGTTDE